MQGGKLIIIKICGITLLETASQAKECGADLIGFVFAPSKRQITLKKAADICRNIKGIGKVGVFVNSSLSEVINIANTCRLDFVQLHGSESPEYCRQVGVPVIKAFRVDDNFAPDSADMFNAAYILCDSFVPGIQGGSGISFDWQKAKSSLARLKTPVLIAGGLNPGNVETALTLLNPAGVDVSGGVETDGVKDHEKIRKFIRTVRTMGGVYGA